MSIYIRRVCLDDSVDESPELQAKRCLQNRAFLYKRTDAHQSPRAHHPHVDWDSEYLLCHVMTTIHRASEASTASLSVTARWWIDQITFKVEKTLESRCVLSTRGVALQNCRMVTVAASPARGIHLTLAVYRLTTLYATSV
jgi:hypothetical protein